MYSVGGLVGKVVGKGNDHQVIDTPFLQQFDPFIKRVDQPRHP